MCGLPPHIASTRPSMKKLTPMVAMNRVSGDWPTSDRSTARSTTKATAHQQEQRDQAGEVPGQPELEEAREVQRGEEHDRALGVVEHAGRLEDDHEADRDQGVEKAVAEPGDHGLEHARGVRRHLGERPDQVSLDHAHGRTRLTRGGRRDRRRSPPDRCAPRPACRRRASCRSPAPRPDPRCPSPRSCRARSGRWSCRTPR